MQPPSSSPSTSTNNGIAGRRFQQKIRHYGSVKYNRLSNANAACCGNNVNATFTSAKDRFFGKRALYHTQSSPLTGGGNGRPLARYGGTANSSATANMNCGSIFAERKISAASGRYLTPQSSLERRLLLPPTTASAASKSAAAGSHRQKQKLMALAPPSLHISFDAAEPEHLRAVEHNKNYMPLSRSSDNFCGYRHSIASGAPHRQNSPSPFRRDVLRPKQRLLPEQSDFAEISSEFMRINGVIQQFKGIMADPQKSSSFFNRTTDSMDADSQILNELPKSCHDGTRTPSRHLSTETYGKQPPSSADSAANRAWKLQVSYRLRRRNELFDLRKKMADYSFGVAVLGIVLMIIENETTIDGSYTNYKASAYSYCLKSLIVLFTLVLLALIISYHAVEIKLFMSDNSCEDWRIAVNRRRVITLTFELLACSICPIPGEFYFTWTTVHSNGSTVTTTDVPVDVLLSIPMFLRCYLVCRVMLLHSRLLTDASSRSIGALNRINFTARFVLKTLMTLSPGTVLLIFTATFWLIAAWVMRLCEKWHVGDPPHAEAGKFQNYLNSLWIIAITSLTIGYGDITPNTYCGRAVSVICGIMGAGTSSLVVAVVAKKLELSRAEKHVHTFMMDSQLSKRLKNAAANVLRETWFIYKYRRLTDKVDATKIRFHQRKFLVAIYAMRKVKRDQRKLAENSVTVSDMAKQTSATYELISDMHLWQEAVDEKIVNLNSYCLNLESQIMQVNASIQKLPDQISLKLLQEIAEQSAQNSLRAPSLISLSNT